MRNISLIRKLSIGFLLAVVGSVIITSLISNYMINSRFNEYLVDEHKQKVNQTIDMVQGLYKEDKSFTEADQAEISRYAVMQELYIEVRNMKNNSIYSSGNAHMQHRSMMESMMGRGMGNMMGGMSNIDIGEYKEETYPLSKAGSNFGSIILGYYGTSYFSSAALSFKMTLNQAFMLSSIITLIFSLGISWLLSRQFSAPLVKITKTANEMRTGNLEIRAEVDTNTKEIQDLSQSINYLAETLQHQEMLRKRLTTDMAHEIRTPITTLKTHVEALIDGIWEPNKERFEVFYEELERLSKLVDNLRNLANLEQHNLKLEKSEFNLSDELVKIADTFRPSYEKQGFIIETHIKQNIFVVMDRDKIKQIMYNLLSNAFKYLNKGGCVRISLDKEGKKLFLRVADNGTGIPEKDLPYIFERFYRSDMSRNKSTGGSGIGLTITKALVEAHGGQISVKSEINKGSVFTIIFPE